MKRMVLMSLLVIVVSGGCNAAAPRSASKVLPALADDLNLAAMVQPVSAKNMLHDKEWFVWCADAVLGEDGKYHMAYARWPKKHGFKCWLTHSEIAYAVANAPTGPYRRVKTIFRGRGTGWDAYGLYNTKIKKFGDKYYLYYAAGPDAIPASQLMASLKNRGLWMKIRNAQRSGVAVADSPAGPWTRPAKPCVHPAGPISKLAVNPGVCQGPDGKYYMILKGDKPGIERPMFVQAIAIATAPTGPFVVQPKAAIDYNEKDKKKLSPHGGCVDLV